MKPHGWCKICPTWRELWLPNLHQHGHRWHSQPLQHPARILGKDHGLGAAPTSRRGIDALGGQAATERAKELLGSSDSKSGSGSVCTKLLTWLPGCFPSRGYFSSSVHVYSGLTCCEEPRYYLWLIIGIWLAGRMEGIRYRGAYTACSKLRSAPSAECACLRCQLTLFSLPPLH